MTENTPPTPAAAFAEIIHGKIAGTTHADPPAAAPEGPRRPRPDASQGSGANGAPTPEPPGAAFTRALQNYALRPSTGLWQDMSEHEQTLYR